MIQLPCKDLPFIDRSIFLLKVCSNTGLTLQIFDILMWFTITITYILYMYAKHSRQLIFFLCFANWIERFHFCCGSYLSCIFLHVQIHNYILWKYLTSSIIYKVNLQTTLCPNPFRSVSSWPICLTMVMTVWVYTPLSLWWNLSSVGPTFGCRHYPLSNLLTNTSRSSLKRKIHCGRSVDLLCLKICKTQLFTGSQVIHHTE